MDRQRFWYRVLVEVCGDGHPFGPNVLMNQPYKLDGAWVYADRQHRRMFDANPYVFLPRAGFAIRVNDRTAVRADFAPYVSPR